jgi:DNA-3-methyladenine glycosylase
MKKILTKPFFDRPTLTVARELLGKYIVRRYRGKTIPLMITEVEAYDGHLDRASHASRGLTPRTSVMFGEAGNFYVYFTYGIHWLVNVVTGPKGYPAAVLLRAGRLENPKTKESVIARGPALLTRYLKIDGKQNGLRAHKKTGLWFEDRGVKPQSKQIIASKRIGVDYAGRIWKNKPYNFKLTQAAKRGTM